MARRGSPAERTWSERLKQWDVKWGRRLGLRFDDPAKTPAENIARAQRRGRFWLRPPIVVDETDFLSTDEAAAALDRRGVYTVNLLVARGILQPAFVSDGRQGVTAQSVMAELEWQRTASRWRKFTRGLGGIIHWI